MRQKKYQSVALTDKQQLPVETENISADRRCCSYTLCLCWTLFVLVVAAATFVEFYPQQSHGAADLFQNAPGIEVGSVNSDKGKTSSTTCGIILNYHIDKCAGGTINNWYHDNVPSEDYLGLYHNPPVREASEANDDWKQDLQRVDDFIKNIQGWKVLGIHHGFPGFFYTKDYFAAWERVISAQGCSLYRHVTLREPLDRFMSAVEYDKVSADEYEDFMVSRRNWLSRYILFNICGKRDGEVLCGYDRLGKFTMTPEFDPKHDKALQEILASFDQVLFTSSLEEDLHHIARMTGWNKWHALDHVHKTKAGKVSFPREIIAEFMKLNKYDEAMYQRELFLKKEQY